MTEKSEHALISLQREFFESRLIVLTARVPVKIQNSTVLFGLMEILTRRAKKTIQNGPMNLDPETKMKKRTTKKRKKLTEKGKRRNERRTKMGFVLLQDHFQRLLMDARGSQTVIERRETEMKQKEMKMLFEKEEDSLFRLILDR